MIKKLSALFLSISIVLVLTACGSDKAVESTSTPEVSPVAASPTNSPPAEASTAPDPTANATPEASAEASATPIITATPEASTPAATAAATPLATPKATASAKPISTTAPTSSPKPTETPKPSEAVNSEAAEALFKQTCTSCHGVDLAGDYGPNLQKIGAKLTKAQITNQITNGGDEMPPFKKALKAEEIQTLAAWLAAKK